jgi:hypothetical protein
MVLVVVGAFGPTYFHELQQQLLQGHPVMEKQQQR